MSCSDSSKLCVFGTVSSCFGNAECACPKHISPALESLAKTVPASLLVFPPAAVPGIYKVCGLTSQAGLAPHFLVTNPSRPGTAFAQLTGVSFLGGCGTVGTSEGSLAQLIHEQRYEFSESNDQ